MQGSSSGANLIFALRNKGKGNLGKRNAIFTKKKLY